jgi:uncharacterized repeat protein (TIGR01451 family)
MKATIFRRLEFEGRNQSLSLQVGILSVGLLSTFGLARAQTESPDHYSWGTLPPSVQVGQPFAAVVQARDAGEVLVTNFSGDVMLSEVVPGKSPTLLITEVETINFERAEFSNVSTNPVDISGWRVVFYDAASWPAPKVGFTFPSGTVCPGLGVFQVRDYGAFPGAYPEFYMGVGLAWYNTTSHNQVALLLLDSAGNPVDFFCAVDAYPALIAIPEPIGSSIWTGPPVTANTNPRFTYQRVAHANHRNAADWVALTNSFGVLNPGLGLPFVATRSTVALTPGSATFTNGVWSGQLVVTLAGNNVVLHADDGNGTVGDSSPLTAVDLPALKVQAPHQAFKATPGFVGPVTISIPQALPTDLAVALTSSRPDLVLVPTNIVVAAGATSAMFGLTNLDDGLLEGPQAVAITANAAGFAPGTDFSTNYDRPPVVLSVSVPPSVSETIGWVISGLVQVSAPVAANVAVRLSSSIPGRIVVPDFTIIPAGQSTAFFGFAPVDDSLIDGNQTVTISASVPGWTSGQGQVQVLDNEHAILSLSLPFLMNEGAGLVTNVGTLRMGGLLLTNLVVALTSDLPARLQVPSNLIIPAGQTSVVFDVSLPNGDSSTGNRTVNVTASAAGLSSATRAVTVVGNDVAGFSFAGLPTSQMAGQPFPATVQALNASGSVAPGYSATINLRGTNSGGTVGVSPSRIGPFTNGVWGGLLTLAGENQGVTLVADDGAGHSGVSATFDVVAGQMLSLPVSDMAFDPLRGKLWAAIATGGGSNAQTVVSIDPVTGTLDAPIPLGAEPGKVAISDDGQFLYVGLTSSNGVVRLNLDARTVDLRFPLLPGGSTIASAMAVPPTDPHALVLQMSGYSTATALYRDGVLLTNTVAPASYVSEYHLAFFDSATNFYVVYPGGLRWVNANESGLMLVRDVGDPQYGGDFVYAGGLLFNSLGAVYDPLNFRRLGSYAANGPVAADANAGEVFFVSGTSLQAFDLPTFAELGQINLPIASGSAVKVLRCGGNVLSIATTQGNLLLVQTALVRRPATADLSVTETGSDTTAVVGSNFVYSVTVSNAGPATATNVTLIDVLPADASLVSVSSPQGVWANTNGLLSYALGDLTNGGSAIVQFIVQPGTPGQLVNSAWITGDGLNPADGTSHLTIPAVFSSVLPAVTRLWFQADILAYDSARNLLWGSVERSDWEAEYSFRSINLSNGLAATSVPYSNSPNAFMAMSADQNYLYAAYVHEEGPNNTPYNRVRRANLITDQIDSDGRVLDQFGQLEVVVDMIGIGSSPSGVIVSETGANDEDVLFVGGAANARSPSGTTPGKLQINPAITNRFYQLVGGYPGGILVKLNFGLGGFSVLGSRTLFALPVSPDNPVATDIRYGDGLMFSDIGLVADPEALTPVAALPAYGLVETDPTTGMVFYLVENASQWTLTAFDLHTLVPVWAYVVPGVLGTPQNLLRCGPGLLAFRTSYDQLFLLNTTQMPGTLDSDVAITEMVNTTSAIANAPVTFTSSITNAGPCPASGVVITNQLPDDATLINVTSSQGTWTNFGGIVRFALGDLRAGATAWVQVVATLNRAGTMTNFASVTPSTPDSVVTNNFSLTTVDFSLPLVADLGVTHQPPEPPAGIGSNLVYTLVISNQGPDIASNVVFSDNVYSGGNLVLATASQGTAALSPGSVTANLGDINSGGTATVSLVVGPCCGGAFVNEAFISSDTFDPNPNDNRSLSVVSLSGQVIAEEIPVPAADIAYDPQAPRILASLSGAIGNITQSIVGIRLPSLALEPAVSVGNQLGRVALSDDSHYLYVGLMDTGGVARVDLISNAVDLRFPLNVPSAPYGPYTVEDLGVMPGSPTTLAAARGGYAGYYSGVALFDSGIQRPDSIETGSAGASGFSIQFTSPTNLDITSPWDFRQATVSSTGLTNPGPVLSGYGGPFAAEGGLVFVSSGLVLDPGTGSLVATYAANGLVATDLANDRVYFLTEHNYGGDYLRRLILKAFDSGTQSELWSVKLDTFLDSATRLIKVGTNGLALITVANRMILVHPSALATPTADTSVQQTLSPNPVTVGGTFTCTYTVQNFGSWSASGIVLSNPVPAGVSFVSATASQGVCGFTNGALICALGSMTNMATATVTVNFTAVGPGAVTNVATVTQNELDLNPTNNSTSSVLMIDPQPTVTILDASVIQSPATKSTISFPLWLSAASSIPISVGYATADGTAFSGQDYDATSGVVTISPGSTSGQLNLPIIRNNLSIQPLDFFYLNLTSVTNASLARTQAVGTIVERKFLTISISGSTVVAGSSGATNAIFTLALNQTSSLPVTVLYQTIDGSATAGSDYSPRAGVLVFSPGTTNVTLAIPIDANPVWQPDKTFSVLLSQPQNAVLGVDEAPGTILSGNPVPALAILSPPQSQAVNPGRNVTFGVAATGNPLPLSYQWQFDGTNFAGATASMLTMTNVQPPNAGNYTVIIGNAAGAFTNASAGLRVSPTLNSALIGNRLILTWTGPYNLQMATNTLGPYLNLPGASSPYTNWIGSEPQRFFRLVGALDMVLSGISTNGEFVINGSGLPGYLYVLEASTNLTDWVSIQTNPAPFQYSDRLPILFPMRFYRTTVTP